MNVLFSNERLLVRRSERYPGSPLLIAFDPYTDDRRLDRPAFGESFSATHGIDTIHVIPLDNDWYQYPELPASLAAAANEARTYDRVVAYGSSMGGYAAIRFGKWAGATEAVALSPQFSIDPNVCPWENRWSFDADRIGFNVEQDRSGVVDLATIFFDPCDADARHVEHYEDICKVEAIRLKFTGHPCVSFLAEIGVLSDTISDLARGTFDKDRFIARARRMRGASAQYLLTLADRLPAHRRNAKLGLLDRVKTTAPDNPTAQSNRGHQLAVLKRHNAAEVSHLHALSCAPGQPLALLRFADSLDAAGRGYDAMCVMARLTAVPSSAVYTARYAELYWNCFRKSESHQMTQAEVEVAVTTTPSPPQDATAWRRHQMQMTELRTAAPTHYLIGDSHAEYWPQELLPPGTFNLGIAGDKTQSLIWRLDRMASDDLLKPRPCIVIAGTNNLASGDSPEGICAGLEAVEAKLKAMTGDQPVYFVLIPPNGADAAFRNDDRIRTNRLIEASHRTLDFEAELVSLGSAAFLPDQIHLTGAAYSRMKLSAALQRASL